MTLTDADIIRAMWQIAIMLIAGFGAVSWWGARWIVKTVQGAIREIRNLERRVTRVEAYLRLPTPMVDDSGNDHFVPWSDREKPR